MEILLTSFGLSNRQLAKNSNKGIFHRMPPVSMSHFSDRGFVPDIAVLLLFEKIVIDQQSYDLLQENPHPSYEEMAQMLRALYNEGFVKLVDFESIVNNNIDLIDEMLRKDIKRLEDWVNPLKESIDNWKVFIHEVIQTLHEQAYTWNDKSIDYLSEKGLMHLALMLGPSFSFEKLDKALKEPSKGKKAKYRNELRKVVKEYLSYINTNIVLSNTLEVGFHDWYDFLPFYREKFITIGLADTIETKHISKINELFRVSFPEFHVWDIKGTVQALRDSRIEDLRSLVNEAVDGKVDFDKEFARRVLFEVFKVESKTTRMRNIVSYLTIPLSFVPVVGTPLEKGVDEIAGKLIQDSLRKKHRWFYLISEFSSTRDE